MLTSRALRRPLLALTVALLVSACGSTPTSSSQQSPFPGTAPPSSGPADPNAAPRPATPAAPPATALATEQRFLEDWFRGTPVVIAATPPSTLQLDVPLVNSFDAGKAEIKPALAAVLDRVAQSLLRQSAARINVSVPTDAGGSPALAQSRGQRLREHLGTRGIAATRVTLLETLRSGGPVQLRLTLPGAAAQPIARGSKNDGGVKPVSTAKPAAGWTEKK